MTGSLGGLQVSQCRVKWLHCQLAARQTRASNRGPRETLAGENPSTGAIIPAVEPRFKAVILASAGLASGTAQPEVDQINFVTRVRQPVLMLNGRFDAIEPVDTAQRPMFELLGTPKDQKKWVVFEDDHSMPAHINELSREAMAWLDRYVGSVK